MESRINKQKVENGGGTVIRERVIEKPSQSAAPVQKGRLPDCRYPVCRLAITSTVDLDSDSDRIRNAGAAGSYSACCTKWSGSSFATLFSAGVVGGQ